ncbi:MAG: hypothetical protein GQ574_26810 [Crocinitomix sp.]|nr:hypothetical protein [Crocinitomix sp.]
MNEANNITKINEISLDYRRSEIDGFNLVKSSNDAASIIRTIMRKESVDAREQMIVLYLSRSNKVLGYHLHSIGTISGTTFDMRIAFSIALKALASGIIIAHNHPSGNTNPSMADKNLTKRIQLAAEFHDIAVLDHLIITSNEHHSFSDNGLLGTESPYPIIHHPIRTIDEEKQVFKNQDATLTVQENQFVAKVVHALWTGERNTRPVLRKIASTFGITDKTKIKELSELGIVMAARELAHKDLPVKQRYDKIVSLYNRQVNLSFRTSQSVLLQQYSTPAPIGFIMGIFCEVDKNRTLFEPSAGNGLLTIAADPKRVVVNEIDLTRRQNLHAQNYQKVIGQDASVQFIEYLRTFDAVITNPPFGRLSEPVYYSTFRISELDHLMALIALDTMRKDGKAAIIIGGHTRWDDRGRIQKGKQRVFFNYLYSRYNVVDVIAINGSKLYSRQGTSFDTRLILIDGVKMDQEIETFAPLKTESAAKVMTSFDQLYERVMENVNTEEMKAGRFSRWEIEALELEAELVAQTLGAPYNPSSDGCFVLDTQVPDSMSFEMHQAVQYVKENVGGDIDNFVRHRLGYQSKIQLCKALAAEQIDAVALAIYNIEALSQALVIGDQTGIGKGRVAASIIRYAVGQGLTPIFLTEKANLFSDIYRDLKAIGSDALRPFIVNSRDSKTHIKDEFGKIVYSALTPNEQQQIFESGKTPEGYDYVVATYSQFNSPLKKPTKPTYLRNIVKGNIIVMDESHNASGSSNTGVFMQGILGIAKGAAFLSATFAKRPDNMPLYAMKTAISEANMTKEELVEAIINGGVALQEIIASQLVAEGQMIRRERTYEGIEVNYETLTDLATEHKRIADNITEIIRDIIEFQTTHIDKRVGELDEIAAAEGKEVDLREGTNQAGVDNLPYFSKVFNIINQMLFSIKAEAVADRAIKRLKDGKKPIIAFSSTMGSFLEQLDDGHGGQAVVGDTVRADFAIVLEKGLEGVLRYTEIEPDGNKDFKLFDLTELSADAQLDYAKIMRKIKTVSTGITISPIDVILQKIQRAGFTAAEVTGRKARLQLNLETNMGLIKTRKRVNVNDAFRDFNNNEVDVLLINQSGSTGASAHAIVTDKVSADQVKQRVMIVLQPELDISTEVQKRGRIHRTGQILKPQYDYINSAIPAEQRLMMMLQKKLKSLDANTSSNQKQSNDILDVPDFLNKYGDEIVLTYLKENSEINELLGDPLKLGGRAEVKEGAAHKVSGRVAVLSTKMQEDFYREVKEQYDTKVAYLKQTGDYDLEVEELDLKAKTMSSSIVKIGKGGFSSFGEDSILEKVEVNILKKPFKREELKEMVAKSMTDETQSHLLDKFESITESLLNDKIREIEERYERLKKAIPSEKKVQKLFDDGNGALANDLIRERTKELESAKILRIKDERTKVENKSVYLRGLFKFFHIGKKLAYPVESYDGIDENQLAVFTGFQIDYRKKNPFAPSAVGLNFAIANSQRYISIPASYTKEVNAIKGASISVVDLGMNTTLNEWEDLVKENTKDRGFRFMVTGNLLQAFAEFKGKLVSYTTFDKQVKKGILLPENWEVEKETDGKVTVPIAKALRVIKSMTLGSALSASGDLAIFKHTESHYRLAVHHSKKHGGQFYLNQELLKLVDRNLFEKIGDRMVAMLPIEKVEKFLNVLQCDLGVTLGLYQNQIDAVGLVTTKVKRKVKIELPPPEEELNSKTSISLLELEAEALELELELLSF